MHHKKTVNIDRIVFSRKTTIKSFNQKSILTVKKYKFYYRKRITQSWLFSLEILL